MVNDVRIEHQPVESIPYLERMISERAWPYSVQEFLESIIKVHRSALPPPQLINAEIVFPVTEKPVGQGKPDRIPVPKTYRRNRYRK